MTSWFLGSPLPGMQPLGIHTMQMHMHTMHLVWTVNAEARPCLTPCIRSLCATRASLMLNKDVLLVQTDFWFFYSYQSMSYPFELCLFFSPPAVQASQCLVPYVLGTLVEFNRNAWAVSREQACSMQCTHGVHAGTPAWYAQINHSYLGHAGHWGMHPGPHRTWHAMQCTPCTAYRHVHYHRVPQAELAQLLV